MALGPVARARLASGVTLPPKCGCGMQGSSDDQSQRGGGGGERLGINESLVGFGEHEPKHVRAGLSS